MTQLTISLPEPPKGWEYTGAYKAVAEDEYFISSDRARKGPTTSLRPVIRKSNWRAEVGCKYWIVDNCLNPASIIDHDNDYDIKRYQSGNYFRTEEQAADVAAILRETFAKIHSEVA